MRVAINFEPRFGGMAVWFYEDRADGRYVVKPMQLELEKIPLGESIEPTLLFDEVNGTEFLNSLATALVGAGFKPDEIKAHDKQVEAMKYHLEDMRNLVFKKGGQDG